MSPCSLTDCEGGEPPANEVLSGDDGGDGDWLQRWYAGDPEAIGWVYMKHFDDAVAGAGTIVPPWEREAVVHDLFLRFVGSESSRRSYKGGSFAAFLRTAARRLALDRWRKRRRTPEVSMPAEHAEGGANTPSARQRILEHAANRQLLDRFRNHQLPEGLRSTFDARFLLQLTQREAAERLGVHRGTVIFREARVRWLLQRFLLKVEGES